MVHCAVSVGVALTEDVEPDRAGLGVALRVAGQALCPSHVS